MLQGNALRHQMVLPEQQAVYDYWRSRCKGGTFPSRFDIEPEQLTEHLPMVTLIETVGPKSADHEATNSGDIRFRYRLAGTGFWALYADEIQGQFVDELPIGDRVDYWHRVLGNVVQKRRPMAGVTRTGTPSGGHLAQFWIRLPLSTDGQNVDMILGYDHLVKLSDVARQEDTAAQLYA